MAAGEPSTLRVRVPAGTTVFDDLLRDPVEVDNATIGDFIVRRSDGTVVYNLAVVVDDVTMEITHVIRGDDHISNTPKQILIYQALGAPVPTFLHMPLLFGTDRKLLEAPRRDQARAAHGHGLPHRGGAQLLCFLSTEFDESMIAWTLDDLVAHFDVEKLGTSASIFDPDKLRWMNGRFIRQMGDAELGERVVGYLTRVGFFAEPAAVGELAGQGPQVLAAAVEAGEEAPRIRRRRRRREQARARARRAAGAREDRRAGGVHPHGGVLLPAARARRRGARAAARDAGGVAHARRGRRPLARRSTSGRSRRSKAWSAACRRRST